MSNTLNPTVNHSLEKNLSDYLESKRTKDSSHSANPAVMFYPNAGLLGMRKGNAALKFNNQFEASDALADFGYRTALNTLDMKATLDVPAAPEAQAQPEAEEAQENASEETADEQAQEEAPVAEEVDPLQQHRLDMVNNIAPALYAATGMIVPLEVTKHGVVLAEGEESSNVKHLQALVPFSETKARNHQVDLNKMISDFVARSYVVEAEDLAAGEEASEKAEAMRGLATEMQNLATDFYMVYKASLDSDKDMKEEVESAFKTFQTTIRAKANECHALDAHRGNTRYFLHGLAALAGGLGIVTLVMDAISNAVYGKPFFASDTTARIKANDLLGAVDNIGKDDLKLSDEVVAAVDAVKQAAAEEVAEQTVEAAPMAAPGA